MTKPYGREKLLRLAKQGKLDLLVPAVVGVNVNEDAFNSPDSHAFQDPDDLTITLIVSATERYVFIGKKE